MTNANLFKQTFGIYAEDFWSFDEKQMLDWLNADVPGRNVGDMISRQAAIDSIMEEPSEARYPVFYAEKIRQLPSAQPEYNLDEWCTDCKEYDHEKHCCPRFNRVIRETIEEVRQNAQPEQRWIPVTERLPEADNRVLICNDEGQYLVGFIKSWRWGNEWSYQLDMHNYDAYDEQEQGKLVAWMPLAKPYGKETEDATN